MLFYKTHNLLTLLDIYLLAEAIYIVTIGPSFNFDFLCVVAAAIAECLTSVPI